MVETQHSTPVADTDTEPEMTDMWTYFEMDADTVAAIRAELAHVIPDDWDAELNPHVSVMPGFEIPVEHAGNAKEVLETDMQSWVGEETTVTRIDCHNNLDADAPTFVLSLDVSMKLDGLRSLQDSQIDTFDGEIHFEPVGAHVTLFKSGDGGDDNRSLTREERQDFRSALHEVEPNVPQTLTITDAVAEEY